MRYQREGDPPAIVLVIDISMRSYNTGLEGFLSSHISGKVIYYSIGVKWCKWQF